MKPFCFGENLNFGVALHQHIYFKTVLKKTGTHTLFIYFRYSFVKFIYSEKATKYCEIFTLLLSTVHTDKSKVKVRKIWWPSQRIYEL